MPQRYGAAHSLLDAGHPYGGGASLCAQQMRLVATPTRIACCHSCRRCVKTSGRRSCTCCARSRTQGVFCQKSPAHARHSRRVSRGNLAPESPAGRATPAICRQRLRWDAAHPQGGGALAVPAYAARGACTQQRWWQSTLGALAPRTRQYTPTHNAAALLAVPSGCGTSRPHYAPMVH